jgi:hypothetical protein
LVEHSFLASSIPVEEQRKVGKTGVDGSCEFAGVAHDLGLLRISKRGWYSNTEKLHPFVSREWKRKENISGNWLPFAKTMRFELKPKGTPVAMYAKRERVSLPKTFNPAQPLGYDLERGEWVAPHGGGVFADFLFTPEIHGESAEHVRWRLKLGFKNKGDGIISLIRPIGSDGAMFRGSELRSPTKAPLAPYESGMEWSNADENTAATRNDRIYIFRIRTVLNAEGEILEAQYGKMYGDPFVDRFWKQSESGRMKFDGLIFEYYLNPDKTTNLEFDLRRNLFGNLPLGHEVSLP